MKTLIAIPCFDMVNVDFVRSFTDLVKPEGTVYTMIKNTLIYNARNFIAKNAIQHDFDRVLWLDSDITCEPDTLIRLSEDMDKGIDFVSGLYFMRQIPTKPVIYSDLWWKNDGGWVETGAINYIDYPEGVFEIDGSGFGCVMTSVALLKRMTEKYGAPFTPLMGLGEDTAFCWRMKMEGEKMYCDSRVRCGHIMQTVIDENVFRTSAE